MLVNVLEHNINLAILVRTSQRWLGIWVDSFDIIYSTTIANQRDEM